MKISNEDAKMLNDFNSTLAFKKTWLFRMLMSLDAQIIGMYTGNRTGKSIKTDTLVTLADGSTKQIKDIKKGDRVYSLNKEMKLVQAKVLDWIDSGVKKGYKMVMTTGAEITSSADHGYFTVDGWKRLGDLKTGDYIATPRGIPIDPPENKEREDSDIYWDKIKSIEPVGDIPMCDLEIGEHHNFVANNIIVHNSHSLVMQYVYRFLSIHPVPEKNVVYLECRSRYCTKGHRFDKDDPALLGEAECPKCNEDEPIYIQKFSSHKFGVITDMEGQDCPECGTKIEIHMRATRVFRFCAENQPNEKSNTGETFGDDGQSAETRNTLYPALKKWLPQGMIKKDITLRNPNVYIKDVWGGPSIIVEFVSYNQSVQSTAGFSLTSILLDEEAPLDFYLEQLPRLIEENGDLLIGCTPANKMTYYYDDVFLKAKKYIRTPSIAKRFNLKQIEETNSPLDIVVLQASSYDNPILDREVIKKMFDNIAEDDNDTVNIRLYGMFSQASGRVFKDFNIPTHVISREKYFKEGIPRQWTHGRFIDYHSHNPWACLHLSISPENEVFVWGEYMPKPDTPAYQTLQKFLAIGGDYHMRVSMVDPFAESVKKDGISVKDDMQQYSREIVKSGVGTTANWQSWDTKSTRGRDQIILRIKNSKQVKRPFNNMVDEGGQRKRLPTLWVLSDCPHTYKSLNTWKYEVHVNPRARVTKDDKEQPQQKWSHFCMCIEAAFKTRQFRVVGNGNKTGSSVAEYFNQKYR